MWRYPLNLARSLSPTHGHYIITRRVRYNRRARSNRGTVLTIDKSSVSFVRDHRPASNLSPRSVPSRRQGYIRLQVNDFIDNSMHKWHLSSEKILKTATMKYMKRGRSIWGIECYLVPVGRAPHIALWLLRAKYSTCVLSVSCNFV